MIHPIDAQMQALREQTDLTDEELADYETLLYLYHDPMGSARL